MVHEHFYSGINPTEKIPAKSHKMHDLKSVNCGRKKKKNTKNIYMSKLQLCNMYTSIAIGVAWDIQRLLGLTILLMIFYFFLMPKSLC